MHIKVQGCGCQGVAMEFLVARAAKHQSDSKFSLVKPPYLQFDVNYKCK